MLNVVVVHPFVIIFLNVCCLFLFIFNFISLSFLLEFVFLFVSTLNLNIESLSFYLDFV
jgi:hypothetical protein